MTFAGKLRLGGTNALAVAFMPDGSCLEAGNYKGTVEVWGALVHNLDTRLSYQMAGEGDTPANCFHWVTASHWMVGSLGCPTQMPLPLTYRTQASFHTRSRVPCRLASTGCAAQALCQPRVS